MSEKELSINLAVSGQYKLSVKHSDGTVTETDWFDNMILNSGLDAMGQDVNFITYCFVGTGNTAVSATQTTLAAKLDTPTAVQYSTTAFENTGTPNYESTFTMTYAFPQGDVVGNITEVGIGHSADGLGLFSRSLITNSSGTPTAIAVVALDEFTVTYRLKLKPPTAIVNGSFSLSGQTVNYTAQVGYAAEFGNPMWALAYGFSQIRSAYAFDPATLTLGDIESHQFGGTPVHVPINPASDIAVNNTYVPGSYRRTGSIGWTYANGNNPGVGIGGMILNYGTGSTDLYFKYLFTNPIMKSNTQELRLNMTISWSRG